MDQEYKSMDKKSKLIFLVTIFVIIGVVILFFIFDPRGFFITSGKVKEDLQRLGYKNIEIIDRHWAFVSSKCPSGEQYHENPKLGPKYLANYDVKATDMNNQTKILNVCVSDVYPPLILSQY